MAPLRIVTRKSPLALWQANYVKQRLLAHHPSLSIELIPVTTQGDKILDRSLSKIGGKGLFLKELETKLLSNEADIAVHSMKDVPTALPEGLEIAAITAREDPRDVLVGRHKEVDFAQLPMGAKIGTSSLRRHVQAKCVRPDLTIVEMRGNLQTRLEKMHHQALDGIILAAAGVLRLKWADKISYYFDPLEMLPAVGQGALGIECHTDQSDIKALIAPLHCEDTSSCLLAERALNAKLGGSCQVPIAALATLSDHQLHLSARVGRLETPAVLQAQGTGPRTDPHHLGQKVAEELLHQGAGPLIAQWLQSDE